MKLWTQGQTTIGPNSNASSQTVAFLLAPSYSNPNILQNINGTTARSSGNLTFTLSQASITNLGTPTPQGVYFLQLYLTVNPYQALPNSSLSAYMTNTLSLLTTLQSQSTSYGNALTTSLTSAQYTQLVKNQAFLQSEINQVNAVLATL